MISDFLKPPTDNLYKFMCISGLILFLLSATFPPWLIYRASMAVVEAKKDSALLQVELEVFKRRGEQFTRQVELNKNASEGYHNRAGSCHGSTLIETISAL